MPPSPTRRSSSTAFTSAGCRAPRARSGNTPPSTSPAFTWAELHTSKRNPRSRHTRELVHRVARDLAAAGWKLREVTTDNGSEFRPREFGNAVERLGARQRFIRAGRPNSNRCVERAQMTSLEECWRLAFARSLIPNTTALAHDLDNYLIHYNYDAPTPGASPKDTSPQTTSTGHAKPAREDDHPSHQPGVRTT
jgi:hypothetical protein